MKFPSTNPDDYIRGDRLHLFLAILLFSGGVVLIAWGADPDKSLLRELGSQLGAALLTTAVIDLLLLRGVESWKRSITAPFVLLAESMQKTDSAMDKVLSDTERLIKESTDQIHREQVEMNLELIKIELEVIRRVVDPNYRQLAEAMENEQGKDMTSAEEQKYREEPPNPTPAADA